MAQYEAAIRSITYTNSSEIPDAATRTVSFTVNDGDDSSNTVTRDIAITSVNDNPFADAALPSDVTVTEDVLSDFDISSLNIGDVDDNNLPLTLKLNAAAGNVSATTSGGVTVTGSGTSNLELTGSKADLNIFINNAANIQYLHPTANINGNDADTVTVLLNDNGNTGTGGGADQMLGTVNVDITAVNDEPTGANNTVTTNEDTDYAFSAGDFGFTDPIDGDSLSAVVITTIPTNGTLYLDANLDGNIDGGEAVSATDAITIADITAGRLKFKPAANANGTSYDSFTFQVLDDGGTANGGVDTDQSPNTMTVDVNSVNDEPAGANNTVTTNEDTDYAFAVGDFGFTDPVDGDSLSAVVISSLPSNGTLYLDTNLDGNVDGGEAVSATQAIAIADITAGRLKFKSAANVNGTGYDSFTFQVRDDGGTANGGVDTSQSSNSMTIDVTSVNDDPDNAGIHCRPTSRSPRMSAAMSIFR